MGPLTAKTVAGSPAFVATATPTAAKDKIRLSMLYFVFDGSTQYEITSTQASDDTWSSMQPTFDKFSSSFTIPAPPSSSSVPSVSSSPSP